MHYSTILLTTLLALPLSNAQQAADGLIVPFTSKLPSCASQCGPLYDVQGKCSPPSTTSADANCFCSDNRLQSFKSDGTTGVSSVCGAASCTSPTDLQAIKTWYQGFCANKGTSPTTTAKGGAGTTSSSTSKPGSAGNSAGGSNNSNNTEAQSWFQSHTKWVAMIIVVVVGIIVIWVGAWLLRKRYLRKKEREIEMRPPVSWGPHQMQGATAGYKYGDGVVDSRGKGVATNTGVLGGAGGAGGHYKEAAAVATPAEGGKRLSKQKMGWFKASK